VNIIIDMIMKKIFTFILFASVLVSIAGVALAAVPSGVKYTAEQQACIKAAQEKKTAAIKVATGNLSAVAPDALKEKQDAIKAATAALDAAIKTALKTKKDAIAASVKIKDAKARADAIKAATVAFNNNPAVKKAMVPYLAAIKAANDTYDNNETVKGAKEPYAASLKTAIAQFQNSSKACLKAAGGNKKNNKDFLQGIFRSLGGDISGSVSGLLNFFSGK
jgi:hypothetical protein